MVNLEHLRVTIGAIFWWYITVVCKHILNKASLGIIKTLTFFSERRRHLRPMVPLKFLLFAMNRMYYNKKGFDLDNYTQSILHEPFFIDLYRSRGVQSCYGDFYTYFLYTLYISLQSFD